MAGRSLTVGAIALVVIAVFVAALFFVVSDHLHREHVAQDCGAVAAEPEHGHNDLEVYKACVRERL